MDVEKTMAFILEQQSQRGRSAGTESRKKPNPVPPRESLIYLEMGWKPSARVGAERDRRQDYASRTQCLPDRTAEHPSLSPAAPKQKTTVGGVLYAIVCVQQDDGRYFAGIADVPDCHRLYSRRFGACR
jgi:hypothetical protein